MNAFNTSPTTNLTSSFTPNTSSFHRVTTEWGQQPPQQHVRRCKPNASSPTPNSSPSSSSSQIQSHASQFAPIRRRQPFGGFDDRASAPSSPRTSRPPSVTQSQQSTMNNVDLRPSKIMKTSNENVYEKTMRLLMTANQETLLDVQPMEEDNEEDGLGQPIEGQSSILSFFTRRNNNCMEED